MSLVSKTIEASFYNGLLGTSSGTFDITCQTGNCSWEDLTSLELCSTCEDVSGSSQVISDPLGTVLATPGGLSLNLSTDGYSLVGYETTLFFINSTADYWDSNLTSQTVMHFVAAGVNESWDQTTQTYYPSSWNVTSCSVDWCMRQYKYISVVRMEPISTALDAASPHKQISIKFL